MALGCVSIYSHSNQTHI